MRKLLFTLAVAVAIPLTVFLLGYIISTLWNLLIPKILYLPEISTWEALGLYVLINMLFNREAPKKIISISRKKKKN